MRHPKASGSDYGTKRQVITANKYKYSISAEQVMTFGDGDNDIAMLRLAKYSYVMENASEAVKAAANFIAPSNAKSGVFQVIEQYLESH
ncbi:MAG: HAD hydrolase family protein [Streptococcus lutetiensis]|nr:HAD hydrolase family protein [Streptococcus lutetiensis]